VETEGVVILINPRYFMAMNNHNNSDNKQRKNPGEDKVFPVLN
jgi:hypothetical protein